MYWGNLKVWNFQPQREKMQEIWDFSPETVEGHGGNTLYPQAAYPAWRNAWSYVVDGRQQFSEMVAFFDEHKGKLLPFWCPSWGGSYIIYSGHNYEHGVYGFLVEKYASYIYDPAFRSQYPSRKRIRIRDMVSGTYYPANIVSYDNVTYETHDYLELDTAYDEAFGMTVQGTQIDFMHCVRFETDTLAASVLARDVFGVKLPVIEVPWSTPGLTQY